MRKTLWALILCILTTSCAAPGTAPGDTPVYLPSATTAAAPEARTEAPGAPTDEPQARDEPNITEQPQAAESIEMRLSRPGIFDPVFSMEELTEMEDGFALTNFASNFTFESVYYDKKISQINDMLWLGGRLLIADAKMARIHILNEDFSYADAIVQLPDKPFFSPVSLASDGDRLYAVDSGIQSGGSHSYNIHVFDKDLNYEKTEQFTLKTKAANITIQSLAVNPDGGFFVTLEMSEYSEDGKIYKISEKGVVNSNLGNKSFGYLLTTKEGVYFTNGVLPPVPDKENGGNKGQFGLPALYNIQNGDITARFILPPCLHTPLGEEEIEEASAIIKKYKGDGIARESIEKWRGEGIYWFLMNGSGGLFRLGGNIAVIDKNAFMMHVFSPQMEYLFSNFLFNNFAEFYEKLQKNVDSSLHAIAACANEEGAVYVAVYNLDNSKYGILRGTPK